MGNHRQLGCMIIIGAIFFLTNIGVQSAYGSIVPLSFQLPILSRLRLPPINENLNRTALNNNTTEIVNSNTTANITNSTNVPLAANFTVQLSQNNTSINTNSTNVLSAQPIWLNNDAAHQQILDRQNQILDWGQNVSLSLTSTLTRPFTFVNNHITQAASTLPVFLATNGAALGSAIATPIQLGTLATNNFVSGLTGTLVSIPIGVVSGGTAQALGAIETGRQFYHSKATALMDTVRAQTPYFLRPIALIGGTNLVSGGIGMGVVGNGMQALGQRVAQMGASMADAGVHVKNLGGSLLAQVNVTTATNTTGTANTTIATATGNSNNETTTLIPDVLNTNATGNITATNTTTTDIDKIIVGDDEQQSVPLEINHANTTTTTTIQSIIDQQQLPPVVTSGVSGQQQSSSTTLVENGDDQAAKNNHTSVIN